MVATESSAPPTIEALQAENARLRARISALESEHTAGETQREAAGPAEEPKQPPILSDETRDLLKDLGSSSLSEIDRLARGLTYALVESIHGTADAVNAAAETAFGERADRRAAQRTGEAQDTLRGSTDDLVASVTTGIRAALQNSHRVARRFLDAYDDEKHTRKQQARPRAAGA
jgi:hypothetical protein